MKNLPPPLNAAIKLAENSKLQHRHGAVIVKHGKIIGRGYNKIRHHRFSRYYPYKEACHAESAAIMDSDTDSTGSVMYIARINRQGIMRNSMPCGCCRNLLSDMGIKRVVYTTNTGWEAYDV